MTVRHMRIFVCLYENNGNVTRTADELYMTQPAVSVALSELEKFYEVKLFDRISRKLHPNEAGTRFYEYAKKILNMFDDMENGMKNAQESRTLRVGCCDSMDACGLPKYISRFAEIHPGVSVHSCVDTSDGLFEKILNNELDLAIVDKSTPDRKIVSEDLAVAELVIAAKSELGYSDGQSITIEELVRTPLLLRERGSGARIAFENAVSARGYKVTPVVESVGTMYVLNAVIQGMGFAILPKNILDGYHRQGKVIYLEVPGFHVTLSYKIVYHSDRELTSVARDFITMCQTFNKDCKE